MTYLLKNKQKKHDYKKTYSIIGVFIVLILLVFFAPKFLRNMNIAIAEPVWRAGEFVASPFSGIGKYFSDKETLIKENSELKDKINQLELKVIDYGIVLNENQELKIQMGRNENRNRVVSRVLSKPPRSPYDTLVIDIGSDDGVVLGNKVYTSDNIIVGIVRNVTPGTSLVEMFSKGDKKQEAVLSRTGDSYTLSGSGGGNFKIEVPKDADVLWGDLFMSPGLSPGVIGSVYYIDTSSQSSFKTIHLRIPGNIFSVKYLFVEIDR